MKVKGPVKHCHGRSERLLCAFTTRIDVTPIAKFGSISAVPGAAPERLREARGVGGTAAVHVRTKHLFMRQAARVLCCDLTRDSARALARLEIKLRDELVVVARETTRKAGG
jgi:hypothetical protein